MIELWWPTDVQIKAQCSLFQANNVTKHCYVVKNFVCLSSDIPVFIVSIISEYALETYLSRKTLG